MFEKNMRLSYLLDFYGELLSERKRAVMDMYYNEDLSLAEIASEIGISRQGARDIIKKSEDELFFFEEKLGLAQKMSALRRHSENMLNLAKTAPLPKEVMLEVEEIAKIIK